jgi:hypothetical protein
MDSNKGERILKVSHFLPKVIFGALVCLCPQQGDWEDVKSAKVLNVSF